MQISYEKCRSGPSGAPAAVPPKLCRGESLPLSGRAGGGVACTSVRARARGPGTGPPLSTACPVQRSTAVLRKRKSSCHSNEDRA